MVASDSLVVSRVGGPDDGLSHPSTLSVGLLSAGSVVGGIGLLTLGLVAMVLLNFYIGLLIVAGALPLWGWACVQNKDLYR